MMVNLGGVIPLSTVDWTGTPSLVVFFEAAPSGARTAITESFNRERPG
jgi:hypothetical protein